MKAFYFANKDRKLRYNDGRSIVVGETHSVEGEIRTCYNGLHASTKLIDALGYAPDNILYQVELSGDIDHAVDKVAARNRKYLAEFDATDIVNDFYYEQALANIELIKPFCVSNEYEILIEYLTKKGEMYYPNGSRVLPVEARNIAYCIAERSHHDAYYAAKAIYRAIFNCSGTLYYTLVLGWDKKDEYDQILTTRIKEATGWDI